MWWQVEVTKSFACFPVLPADAYLKSIQNDFEDGGKGENDEEEIDVLYIELDSSFVTQRFPLPLALIDQQILQGNQALGQILSVCKNFLGGRREEEDKKELSNLVVFLLGYLDMLLRLVYLSCNPLPNLMPFRYVRDCDHTAGIVGDVIQRGPDSIR